MPSPNNTSNSFVCVSGDTNARGDTVSVALITELNSKMSLSVKFIENIFV
jgi:hypothetical protein